MMQEFQNALFINPFDPTNAVIYDKTWLRNAMTRAGLVITRVYPPSVRGFQWRLVLELELTGKGHVDFPEDVPPKGLVRPPF